MSNLSLNSTGSEERTSTTPNESSPDTSDNPPYNTPVKGFAMSTPVIPSATQLNAALFQVKNDSVSESEYDIGRHAHNAKERARRYVESIIMYSRSRILHSVVVTRISENPFVYKLLIKV